MESRDERDRLIRLEEEHKALAGRVGWIEDGIKNLFCRVEAMEKSILTLVKDVHPIKLAFYGTISIILVSVLVTIIAKTTNLDVATTGEAAARVITR